MLRVLQFIYNPFSENTYVVFDDESGLVGGQHPCVVIDPGCAENYEAEDFQSRLDENGVRPVAVLLTHCHFDHIGGVKWLQGKYDCPVYMNPADRKLFDYSAKMAERFGQPFGNMSFTTTDISDAQVLETGGMSIICISTPGHSPGGTCFHFDREKVLFSGDTLFAETIGRSDLPFGDYDELIRSIMERLILLDADTKVFPGHGDSTDIAHERTHNPFLEPFNEPEEGIDPDEIEPIALSGIK